MPPATPMPAAAPAAPAAAPVVDTSWKDKIGAALAFVDKKLTTTSNALYKFSNVTGVVGQAMTGLGRTFEAGLAVVQDFAKRFVGLFNPAAVVKLELATNDLYASIGEALLPVLDKATAVIRTVADSIAELGPQGKLAIAVLGGAAIGLAVTAAGAAALAVALNAATLGLPALIAVVAGVGAGAAFAVGGLGDFGKGLSGFKDVLAAAFEAVGAVVANVAAAIQPAMAAFAGSVGGALKAIFGAMNGAGDVAAGLGAGLGAVAQVFGVLVKVAAQVLAPVVAIAQVLLSVVGPVVEGLGMALRVVAIPLKIVGAVFAAVGAAVGRVAGMMARTFESVMAAIRPAVDAIEKAGDAIANAVGGAVVSAFQAALPFIEGAADLLGRVIVRVADGIKFVAEKMQQIIEVARELGLLSDVEGQPAKRKPGASEGKSIRQVNYGSVQDVINRSYQAAASGGRGADNFAGATAKNTEATAKTLGRIETAVNTIAGARQVVQSTAAAGGGAAAGVLGGGLAGAILRQF